MRDPVVSNVFEDDGKKVEIEVRIARDFHEPGPSYPLFVGLVGCQGVSGTLNWSEAVVRPLLVDLGDPSTEDLFELPDKEDGFVLGLFATRQNVRAGVSGQAHEELLVGRLKESLNPAFVRGSLGSAPS